MSDLEPEFGDLNKGLRHGDMIEQRMAAYALENRQALYFDGKWRSRCLRTDRQETSKSAPAAEE